MVRRDKVLACSIALLLAHTALADEQPQSEYLSVLGGYVHPSHLPGTTGRGATGELLWGHPFTDRWSLEVNLNGSIFEAGTNNGNDFYQQSIWVDGVYNVFGQRGHGWTGFLIAGLGALRDDFYPDNRDGGGGMLEAGGGIVTPPLYKGVMLRAEARSARDTKEGGINEPRFTLGFEIPLGRVDRVVETKEVKTVEVREVVREVVRETPVAVAPSMDSDGDGVDDAHDQCPGTPHGIRVDAHGCAIANQVLQLKDVNFDLGKATLTSGAKSILDGVASGFSGQRGMQVEIAGHTDTSGKPDKNLALSQERADAVRSYLVSKGASPSQLTAKGYGQTQLLVSPERTALDRERNRRVELRVLSAGQPGAEQ